MSVRARVVPLVKAHAFGNDFLLAHERGVAGHADLAELTRRACDRHRGIGADGLMVVEDTTAGARTRLFNADGGEAELSGQRRPVRGGMDCATAGPSGTESGSKSTRPLAPGGCSSSSPTACATR